MRIIHALFVLTLLGLTGCGQQAVGLKGAVHKIPIYPGAEVTDTMGGRSAESVGALDSPDATDSLSWWLKSDDPTDKIVEFYEASFPQAEKIVGPDDDGEIEEGETVFRYQPPGAEQGEEISIVIRPNEIQITESVKASKRKE